MINVEMRKQHQIELRHFRPAFAESKSATATGIS